LTANVKNVPYYYPYRAVNSSHLGGEEVGERELPPTTRPDRCNLPGRPLSASCENQGRQDEDPPGDRVEKKNAAALEERPQSCERKLANLRDGSRRRLPIRFRETITFKPTNQRREVLGKKKREKGRPSSSRTFWV